MGSELVVQWVDLWVEWSVVDLAEQLVVDLVETLADEWVD